MNSASSRVTFTKGTENDIPEDGNGFIMLGCGGKWQEWIDGLDEDLRTRELMKGDDAITKVIGFKDGNIKCLYVEFTENVNLNKLAMWRLQGRIGMHPFACKWVEDYFSNKYPEEDDEEDDEEEDSEED